MQAASYALCFEEMTNKPIDAAMVINVTPNDHQLFVIEGDELINNRKVQETSPCFLQRTREFVHLSGRILIQLK